MSPPVVHFVVCVAAPNFWAFLHSSVAAPIFGRSYAVLPVATRHLKSWISVSDRITGSTGFFPVWLHVTLKLWAPCG